jgi:hypothetical protein
VQRDGLQTLGAHAASRTRRWNTGSRAHDALVMKHPSDSAKPVDADAAPRRRDHLRLVTEQPSVEAEVAAAIRPRTIGRLIAQTALIAETATMRRREEKAVAQRGGIGRLMGRFRSV